MRLLSGAGHVPLDINIEAEMCARERPALTGTDCIPVPGPVVLLAPLRQWWGGLDSVNRKAGAVCLSQRCSVARGTSFYEQTAQ